MRSNVWHSAATDATADRSLRVASLQDQHHQWRESAALDRYAAIDMVLTPNRLGPHFQRVSDYLFSCAWEIRWLTISHSLARRS